MTTPQIKRAGALLGLGALLAFGPAAVLQAQTVEVALGASGETVTLMAAEGGGFTRDGAAFASGSEVTASDGSRYVLTLADGIWSAVRQIVTVPVAGTGLTATVLPEGGYRIGEATLGADGSRVDVTEGGASYHVLATADGELSGVRFDLPIDGRVLRKAAGKDSGVTPTLSEDDRKTAADETGTQLKVGGATFSIGELLEGGAASASGANIVAGTHRKVAALRDRAVALVALFDGGGLERSTLSTLLGSLWDEADDAVEDVVQPDIALERDINPRRVVDALDQVVEALATEDGFVAAVAGGGDGVLAGANIGAAGARTVFNRNKWEAAAVLDTLGGTRFGAMYRREHPDADRGIADVAREAFAWSTLEGLRQLDDIRTAGSGYYEGRTLAVDSGRKFYAGDIELQVRLASAKVNGLVTDLRNTATGELWSRGLGGPVEAIFLPEADLRRSANWTARSGDARLSYVPSAGGYADAIESGSGFDGRLLGVGEDAGAEAVGVWSVGSVLAGGFGAVLGGERADPADALINDLTSVKASRPGTTLDTDFSQVRFDGSNLEFKDVDDHQDFKVSLATLFGEGQQYPVMSDTPGDLPPGRTKHELLAESFVATALKELKTRRDFLRQFVEVFPADSAGAVAKSQRENALWRAIRAIDENLFGHRGTSPRGAGRSNGPGSRILNEGTGAVIGASVDNPEGIYPTTSSGRFADNLILARLDAVIEALSDREAFAAAFEEGGVFDGVYHNTSDPYHNELTPDQIFEKAPDRLLLWTETTAYTRFGAWELQEGGGFASRARGAGLPRWEESGARAEGFAYSPLAQSTYSGVTAPGYPAGSSATYLGTAVAQQGDGQNHTFYTGELEARVAWSAFELGGAMRLKISNLTSTDPALGRLRQGWPHNEDPSTGLRTVPRAGVFEVRSLTFSAEITNSGGKLGFRGAGSSKVEVELDTVDGKPQPWVDTVNLNDDGKIHLWSGYTAAGGATEVDRVDQLTLDSSITPEVYGPKQWKADCGNVCFGTALGGLNLREINTWAPKDLRTGISGTFVGQDPDGRGPLAIIGNWTVGTNLPTTDQTQYGPHFLGVGANTESEFIRGSFGADLAP